MAVILERVIELGAKDEGASGSRRDGFYCAGSFRDLDGNKLNFFVRLNHSDLEKAEDS